MVDLICRHVGLLLLGRLSVGDFGNKDIRRYR